MLRDDDIQNRRGVHQNISRYTQAKQNWDGIYVSRLRECLRCPDMEEGVMYATKGQDGRYRFSMNIKFRLGRMNFHHLVLGNIQLLDTIEEVIAWRDEQTMTSLLEMMRDALVEDSNAILGCGPSDYEEWQCESAYEIVDYFFPELAIGKDPDYDD